MALSFASVWPLKVSFAHHQYRKGPLTSRRSSTASIPDYTRSVPRHQSESYRQRVADTTGKNAQRSAPVNTSCVALEQLFRGTRVTSGPTPVLVLCWYRHANRHRRRSTSSLGTEKHGPLNRCSSGMQTPRENIVRLKSGGCRGVVASGWKLR